MNALFNKKLSLKSDRRNVAARGPCIDWQVDDASAVIENVRITQGSVTATSPGSATVLKPGDVWALDVSSSSQLTPGPADGHAAVTVTKTDGTHYHPLCYYDVKLQLSP